MIEELRTLAEKATLPDLPGYEIHRDGQIWSVSHNWRGYGSRKLSAHDDGSGYLVVRLMVGGLRKKFRVHQLVARAFCGDRPSPEHQVRHLDGNSLNNAAGNLCWGTAKENAADRGLHGRTRAAKNGRKGAHKISGERGPMSKLCWGDVWDIRERSAHGDSVSEIAKSYPLVSARAIQFVVEGKTWKC
jgi:hypothetical protein